MSLHSGKPHAFASVRSRSWSAALLWACALGSVLLTSCAKRDQNTREAAGAPATEAPAPAAEAAAVPAGAPAGEVAQPSKSFRNGPDEPPEGEPNLAGLTLPSGFSIEVYSADVPNARSLALGANGTVFASNRRGDKVYALTDANGDFKVDRVHVVAKDLDTPNGLAYRNGSLYIAEIERLLRLDGIDDRLENPPKPVVLTDELPQEEHHGWRYLRFGPDGWLYMPVGAPCNVCKREEPIFSTIARMQPDGKGLEVFASGVRNTLGLDWHPETKELWFTENGRDELGDDVPPDELNRAPRAGMHFGFPHCHGTATLDPEFGKGESCAKYEPPVQLLDPHVAALGMRFYTGKMFPAQYRNAIIFAEHGSWNRSRKSGYRVMVVRLEGNRAVSYEPLVSGWLDASKDRVTGRPVDVEVLRDGSLLISDDYRGAVYRVTYRG